MPVGSAVPDATFPTTVWDGESVSRDDRATKSSPDWQDWARIVSELIATQTLVKAQQVVILDLTDRIETLEAA